MKFKPGDKVKSLRVLYPRLGDYSFPLGSHFTVSSSTALVSPEGVLVNVTVDDSTVEHADLPHIEEPSDEGAYLDKLRKYSEPETAAKPSRYNKTGTTLEVWDAIEQLGLDYKQGNVLKYSYRYKDKNGPEDLCKAINYIIKMLSQETGIDYYELHKLTPEELAKRVKK